MRMTNIAFATVVFTRGTIARRHRHLCFQSHPIRVRTANKVPDPRTNGRMCVYTVLFGGYEDLLEQPVATQSEVDFICFVDNAGVRSRTWRLHVVDPATTCTVVCCMTLGRARRESGGNPRQEPGPFDIPDDGPTGSRTLYRWLGLYSAETTRSARLWSLGTPAIAFGSAGLLILRVGRNQWFFGDEWAFLLGRQATSLSDLLRPHNEHWSTIPILVYRGLYNIFGIASYRPYLAMLVTLNICVALTVFSFLRRSGATVVVSTACGLLLMLFGAGANNVIWALQIGFVASLLFSLLAFYYLQEKPSPRGDRMPSVWLVAALSCSALGVSALVGASLVVILSRRRSSVIRILGLPWLALSLWLLAQCSRVSGAHERDTIEAILMDATAGMGRWTARVRCAI